MKNICSFYLCAALLLLMSGCATEKVDTELARIDDAARLHQTAKMALNSGNYLTAIQSLERLDSLYPYGPYAHQSQLSLIYAYHKANDAPKAIATADRFIRQNPRHHLAPRSGFAPRL